MVHGHRPRDSPGRSACLRRPEREKQHGILRRLSTVTPMKVRQTDHRQLQSVHRSFQRQGKFIAKAKKLSGDRAFDHECDLLSID